MATWQIRHGYMLAILGSTRYSLLVRAGARTEASFVSLAEPEEHPILEKPVREAVRKLGEAGKIRKLRSRKTGRELLTPVERMTERELETLLIGVMADPRSGIRVPEGSKLSRRVERFRKAKAAARKERIARESGAERPVEA